MYFLILILLCDNARLFAITPDDPGITPNFPRPGIHQLIINLIYNIYGKYREFIPYRYNVVVVGLVTASGYWLLFPTVLILSSPDRVLWIFILYAITVDCVVKTSNNPDSIGL